MYAYVCVCVHVYMYVYFLLKLVFGLCLVYLLVISWTGFSPTASFHA